MAKQSEIMKARTAYKEGAESKGTGAQEACGRSVRLLWAVTRSTRVPLQGGDVFCCLMIGLHNRKVCIIRMAHNRVVCMQYICRTYTGAYIHTYECVCVKSNIINQLHPARMG